MSYAGMSYAGMSYAGMSYAGMSYAGMSYAGMSYAGMSCIAVTGRMHGTQRIRRNWHTAEGDCCRKRDKGFVKQASLL